MLVDDPRNAAKARRKFAEIDKGAIPHGGYHLLVEGRPRCQFFGMGDCETDSLEYASRELLLIRLECERRGVLVDVRVQLGRCPNCQALGRLRAMGQLTRGKV